MASFFWFIAIFSAAVIVHELGHFSAARRCGLVVGEFAIGFPFSPRIITLFRHRETEFTIRLLPIGGFVGFSGGAEPGGFGALSSRQKLFVIAAGPVFNLLFAAILFPLYFMFHDGLPFFAAAAKSAALMQTAFIATGRFLFHLASTGSLDGLSGPVGIASMAGAAAIAGVWSIIYFVAVLSLSLGIMNFLPLPALDGGQIVMIAAERLKGSPFNEQTLALVNNAGMALLLLLSAVVTVKDVAALLA